MIATRASDGVLAPPSGDKACIAGGAGLGEVVATDEIDVTAAIAVEGEDGIIEQGGSVATTYRGFNFQGGAVVDVKVVAKHTGLVGRVDQPQGSAVHNGVAL